MRISASILGKYAFLAGTILLLLTSLAMATFYLTEEIQGEARRINLAGRQRMHVFHMANHAHFLMGAPTVDDMDQSLHLEELNREAAIYEQVLYGLRSGCQTCDLFPLRQSQSAAHRALAKQLDELVTIWEEAQKPWLQKIMANPDRARNEGQSFCLGCHEAFVHHFDEVDAFVTALAQHNEQVVHRFNLLRLGLLAISGLAAVLIAVFVKQQMIRPVVELHRATLSLERGDFSSRMTPRTHDEIGRLAQAFNRMAETLGQSLTEKEELVRQRTVELQNANEELKAFAYTISHDLRAPLRAIQGFSAAIREDGQDLALPIIGHMDNISAAADFMDNLIADLLSYSQIAFKDVHLERVAVGRIIDEVVGEMSSEITKADGQLTIDGCLPEVMANHGILFQILLNLFSNALKFVKADESPIIRVWAETKGELVRLSINDNGIGIAPPDQRRIFDVFVRLHGMERYPGTGIGLASVRRGMERLGGHCGVDSAPGQGSTFWLELPLAVQGCPDGSGGPQRNGNKEGRG